MSNRNASAGDGRPALRLVTSDDSPEPARRGDEVEALRAAMIACRHASATVPGLPPAAHNALQLTADALDQEIGRARLTIGGAR